MFSKIDGSDNVTRGSGCSRHVTFEFRQCGGGLKPNWLVKTHYIETGAKQGKVLLILHGWGCDASVYADLIEKIELSRNYRVILPELPGFGKTPEPPEPWGVQDYANFVLRFCETLNIESEVELLFAHSFGCRISIYLLNLMSREFCPKKVVFTGAAGIKPKRTNAQNLKTHVFKLKKALLKPFPRLLEKMRQKYGSADYRAASPIMRQCLVKAVNQDQTDSLQYINHEVLLIWGENDDSTPLADGQLMERLIPNAGLAVIKNAGHYAFLEQPELFYKILDSYLEG